MKKIKFKPLLMAVAMIINTLPFSPVKTAAAESDSGIKWSFVNSGGSNENNAPFIITGQSINISTSVPAGYDYTYSNIDVSVGEDLPVTFGKDKPSTDKIGYDASGKVGKLTIGENILPGELENGVNKTGENDYVDKEATYSIRGKYASTKARATLIETPESGGAVNSQSIISYADSNGIPIMTDGSLTLECTKAATEIEPPHFEITDKDKATGFFAAYKDGKVVYEPYNNGHSYLIRAEGKSDIRFTYTPTAIYKCEACATENADGTTTPKKDKHIQVGATIQINFSVPASNSLFINVMTPQAAMRRIAEEISKDDGSQNQYILLEKDDKRSAITQNFRLTNRFLKYSDASFYIEWSWTPQEFDEKREPIDNPGYKEKYANVVTISSGTSETSIVKINRQKEDITGYLSAQIYYERTRGAGNGIAYASLENDAEVKKPVKIPITIYGTGDPVGVTQTAEHKLKENNGEYEASTDNYGDKPKDLKEEKAVSLKIDAYNEPIPGYNEGGEGPYQYDFKLNMGKGNGKAEYAVIKVEGDEGLLKFELKDLSSQDTQMYTPNGKIENNQISDADNGAYELYVKAASPEGVDVNGQTVKMTITFFVRDHNEQLKEKKFIVSFTVHDSTPSRDARLENLIIKAYEKTDEKDIVSQVLNFFSRSNRRYTEISFGFNPDIPDYDNNDNIIILPYRYDSVSFVLEPMNKIGSSRKSEISRFDVNENNKQVDFKDGLTTDNVKPFEVEGKESDLSSFADKDGKLLDKAFRYEIQVPAQHPDYNETYSVLIKRASPSTDSALASIGIYDESDKDLKNNYITKFDAQTYTYNIQVPYSTKRLRVNAAARYIDAAVEYAEPGLTADNMFSKQEWFELNDYTFNDAGYYLLTIQVQSEEYVVNKKGAQSEYIVRIYKADPNTDATLKSFSVFNKKNEQLKYTPNFDASPEAYNFDYQLSIPYSEKGIRFSFTPNDKNVNKIEVFQYTTTDTNNLVATTVEGEAKGDVVLLELEKKSELVGVLPMNHDYVSKEGSHKFIIKVTAEDGETVKEYNLHVSRDEPSSDAYLKSLIVQDQDYVPIPTFAFNSNRTEYVLEVPYEVTAVNFIPTARHAGAIIDIVVVDENPVEKLLAGSSGKALGSGMTSKNYQLGEPGVEKKFNIKVTAEDAIENPDTGTIVTYEIIVVRAIPSNDSRLKKLDVSNLTEDGLSPIFKASATSYTAALKEGAEGTVITPTANHESAVITVDGIVVESGKASELIAIIEVKQKVVVEVTAQDGVSKTSYVINFTNENLIEKTSNADLRNLTINSGLMTPNFQAAVTEYEVVVEEDVYSVDIIPKTDDPLAQMRVLIGSKEIGDYNGNYAQAISDGKNQIKIEVTSPDESVKKVYTVDVYKDDEKHMKTLLPLDAEDIDFENSDDIITISINQYPRIKSNVFESLKEYPEKTIILQGNDYSLEFKSKDLDTLIPQLEIYDFRMSFDPPHEDDIYDLISAKKANKDIVNKVVMAYFDYHGDLPGTATLHLSLGNKYKNQTLYWHYYNEERYRIDYYGEVESNARGSISVQLDHFSTYVVSPKHKIIGSEDRSEIIEVAPTDKVHPFTGSKEEI